VPRAVEEAEIAEIVESYAAVAANCAAGGFDGVELQCSHSSIVRAFLSPATNLRTDGFGGGLPQRARLLLEILAAVRDSVGGGLAVGVRLCGDELVDGGTTLDEAVAVARMVEAQGCADYVNTSIGTATATLYMIEASMHVPPGYASFVSSAIRNSISLPVVGVGRYKDPAQAERALAAGHCDLVGIVRGQIADPDFAAKARAGRPDAIRLCLSCNQECVGRMGMNRSLGCIENPDAGHEASRPGRARERTSLPGRRRVVVAGAGPAGLQAAIAAASRGHEVVVLEREPAPGGQIRLAASVPSRAELGDLTRNQLSSCRHLPLTLRLSSEATAASVLAESPDAVIVATGSRPARPQWASPQPGAPRIADVREVLDGSASPTGRVLVVDELGFQEATSVAELLADRGCAVEVTTPAMVVGQDLGITLDLEGFNMRAAAKGIVQSTDRVVVGCGAGRVSLLHHPTGETEERSVDWVVLAVPAEPEADLYFALREEAPGLDVQRVGDCLAPRRAHAAVIEGERAGASL
jgi:mycofactocin system FadH/OYE family oxidoreductase 2